MKQPVNELGIAIVFTWNGDHIADIYEWARGREVKMVRYRHTWREALPFAGRIEERVEEREHISEMPAPFFESMRFGGARDDQFHELERFSP